MPLAFTQEDFLVSFKTAFISFNRHYNRYVFVYLHACMRTFELVSVAESVVFTLSHRK